MDKVIIMLGLLFVILASLAVAVAPFANLASSLGISPMWARLILGLGIIVAVVGIYRKFNK
ncbi:hypothetical protein [Levilactobacillus bambusae]|uniref:Uncharacterized protein n=1 Tax=Levilactobacillus bambusae TaxID=2024736 RepID=A0A2V1MZR7_9LACO|nr:hypothetical protein [Levilactobacillus bambusae]PWG00263.1 hypothetical protein DCM90_04845 [Levilactobacillus bambusae]